MIITFEMADFKYFFYKNFRKLCNLDKNVSTYVFSDILRSHSLVRSVCGVEGAEDQPAKSKEWIGHADERSKVKAGQYHEVRENRRT